VNDRRVDVSQEGMPCVIALGERGHSFGASGGVVDVSVAALPGCPWSTVSTVGWVITMMGATGSGPGAVKLRVAPNVGPERRGTTLTIGGQTFGIDQEAVSATTEPPVPTPEPESPTPGPPPPPTPGPTTCSYAVTPSRIDVGPDRAHVDIEVTTAGACSWTGASEVGWIRLVGRASGTGADRIRLAVDENEMASTRTGTALVARQIVWVNQAGRQQNGEVHVAGRASAVSGTCPTLAFVVGGRAVVTRVSTRFVRDCTEVANDADVDVRGETQPNGQILAARVQVKK
jgi:hypothetical protein